jgi:ribosomal protein L4
LNKKERRAAFIAALADRFGSDAVSIVEFGDAALGKTAELARMLFGSAGAAKKGPSTLIVAGRDERLGSDLDRVARNLKKVGVTHTGALDVKDVLRFSRLLFTSQAYSELVEATKERA